MSQRRPTRSADPVQSGHLRAVGFRIYYEVFGNPQSPPVLLLPTWQVVSSRHRKMHVPSRARSFQVIAWDPPGIGGGERTTDTDEFQLDRVVGYGVGLLDHLGIDKAVIVGLSMGGSFGLWMAAHYPERFGPDLPLTPDWAREHFTGLL